MSYAKARSRFINLLIKAEYDPYKCIKAFKYPYVEALDIVHQAFNGESQKFYQKERNYIPNGTKSFVVVQDKEYRTRGGTQKVKAQVVVPDASNTNSGFYIWVSYKIELTTKYVYPYPNGEIRDTFTTIGRIQYGVSAGGVEGVKEGVIPLPEGGWEKIIMPEE